MKVSTFLKYTGIGLVSLAAMNLLGLTYLWVRHDLWPAISLADAFAFVDIGTAAWIQSATSDSDTLYFIAAELPLYALLLAAGLACLACWWVVARIE